MHLEVGEGVGVDTVLGSVLDREIFYAGQLCRKNRTLEPCVMLGRKIEELIVAEPAGPTDRIDVEIVAHFSAAVESTDLVRDGIGQAEDRADIEAHRIVCSPIEPEVHLENVPIRSGRRSRPARTRPH